MGVVYRAHDTLLERVVALKIIATSIEANPELRERFFREARAAGQLSHRNIITIHDLGEHEGQPYLAMEFLTGEDLQHRLARQEPMSLRRKLEVAAEICEGLSYAHRRGLIHRDIKPANIFITDDGVVKLLDFGLARMVASELTRSNMMMGTVNYMAPEQVRGERTDHRADIFSFGVVFYEMLSGRKAFQGDSFATTLYKILQDVPEPLHNIDATLPSEIVWLVERALAKPRDERYQDLSDLSRDLAIIRQHLSGADAVTMAGSGLPGHRPQSDPPRTPSHGGTRSAEAAAERAASGTQPSRRSWAALAAVGVAVVALAVTGWWFALRPSPGANTVPEKVATPPVESKEPVSPPVPAAPPPRPEERSTAGQVAEDTQQAQRRTADEARLRMTRAKAAARQAGPAATGSAAYVAAAAAEREAVRLFNARQLPEATAKFYEASGLFRSAELTSAAAPAPPSQRAESKPQPAPTPPAAPPSVSSTPSLPPGESQIQLPPAPAPRVPPPAAPPPKPTAPPATTAAEGTASPVANDAIRELVRRYEQALEARNIDALKRIWPTLQGSQEDAMRKEFAYARRIDVGIDDLDITVSGGSGTATFLRRYELATVDGQRHSSNSRTTMSVRRAGADWLIDRVRFEGIR